MKSKYLKIFVISISLFFMSITNIEATTYVGTLTGNKVSLRKGPGTNYDSITYLDIDSKYTMDSNMLYDSESGCTNKWYKINYNGTYGYICSDFLNVKEIDNNENNTCKENLKSLGFPDSYIKGLCDLKSIHPTWDFIPLLTGLEWNDVVDNESSCGQSYVNTDKEEDIDRTCINQYQTTGKGWYPASKKIVAYYLDPRNFFSEKYIFQFEALSYSSSLSAYYPTGIKTILKNAAFYIYHNELGNDFADTLNNAASNANVNAVFLASRILQEMGSQTTLYNLYSGIYSGYEGYYNFYNYGVTDSCATTYGTTYCGLTFAQKEGWNSLYNALYGGASMLASNYIAQNQNTNYLQKFNVVPISKNKIYLHQYMTNIAAPSSESSSSYKVYSNNNLLDSPFVFYIPVYKNISNDIDNSGSGASGESNNNTVSDIDISTLVTSSGFKYSSSYISGIELGSDVCTIKSALESVGAIVQIVNSNGVEVTSGRVATGYKVKISNNKGNAELSVVVKGDTSGDGEINALDLLQVQKKILGTYMMDGAYSEAADTSRDGEINALDLLQIQKKILGTYEIEK